MPRVSLRIIYILMLAMLSVACSTGGATSTLTTLAELRSRAEIEVEFELYRLGAHSDGSMMWEPQTLEGADELWEATLKGVFEFADGNPPPRDTVHGGEEWLGWLASCGRSLGVEIQVSSNGVVSYATGNDALRRTALVVELCRFFQSASGATPKASASDESAIRDKYARYVNTYECLKANGFPVADPPSLESFDGAWSYYPYSAFGVYGPDIFMDVDLGTATEAEMEALVAQLHPSEAELVRAMWTCPIALAR